ncbi:glutathione S-transferase [Rhodothalassium salexigens DSM 2132]|uniref:Glutathione S-transferase n=1 Tax=Rhodothalassium salexigens DSM 2132 TaxID=1188247 RepID=A0A4R2PF15_RHOSA|nr:glutathione S-transferase family protein [Rhodothalassium salexigens]MBB4211822.1 glutathione S-transferase [Rhodothalassium salexigens DSM 2132]MBK1638157.1 hypothetical protein [Rhodothalassium salexigens DSM 2132]TCP33880.1 glutathione S-transferase [Rhodothalassium salexigens DSM 2132]
MTTTDLTLYGGSLSPYYERVLLALDVKGATEQVAQRGIPGGSPQSMAYRTLTPVAKIPALLVDDAVLVESRAILTYLDRRFPEPALVPAEPLAAGRAEMLAQLADSHVMPKLSSFFALAQRQVFTGDEVDRAKADLTQALDDLEHFFADDQFAVGDAWTVADCVLVPLMFFVGAMDALYHYGGLDGRPRLAGWYERTGATGPARASHARQQAALNAAMGAPA